MTTVLGKGIYTILEAANLTQLSLDRVREWFGERGRRNGKARPVFQSDYPILNGKRLISFLDLVEVNIAGKLRNAGVSLQNLRDNYRKLRDEFGDHPFCTQKIPEGGRQSFTRGLDGDARQSVTDAMNRRAYFDTVISPFLERIEYDRSSHRAARWHIADHVVVDPQIQFGKPTVAGAGIRTAVLCNSFQAYGKDPAAVAHWFGIEERDVLAAVAFEASLAA